MERAWTNWSGSLEFRPRTIERPESETEIQKLVRRAADTGESVRVVGQGHSSTPLVKTDGVLVSLEQMSGIVSTDVERREARVLPGTQLGAMGEELLEDDLQVHNLGDVDVQQLGGAIGTGTHGTGNRLGNLSTMLLGVRMVTADGEVVERHIEDDPQFIRAARVGLGTLGIFTELRISCEPARRLHRQEWCTGVDACLEHLHELIEQNRNFDFYWYPRSDEVKLRTLNEPDETPEIPYADLQKEEIDWAPRVLAKTRELRFDEMEYALPYDMGPSAFLRIRDLLLNRHRRDVAWRTLYRTTAADDALLSPSYERKTVTISVHHNATLPFGEFFEDVEPILRDGGGRPHWGKKHSLRAAELSELYPEWERFQAIRRRFDPEGRFMTDYLRELLEG